MASPEEKFRRSQKRKRNLMAKELHKPIYHQRSVPPKKKIIEPEWDDEEEYE